MAITDRVKRQFFENEEQLIRLAPSNTIVPGAMKRNGKPWSLEEHNRFLEALGMYPSGPWKLVAAVVGTRTTRQTMTHAQKYRERIARKKRDEKLCGSSTAAVASVCVANCPASSSVSATTGAVTPTVTDAEFCSGGAFKFFTDEFAISESDAEHLVTTLEPLFQASDATCGSFDDLTDDLDDEFIEECLDQLLNQ